MQATPATLIAAICLMLVTLATQAETTCSRQWLCLDIQEGQDRVDFKFSNQRPYPVTVTIGVSGENVIASPGSTHSYTLNGNETHVLMQLHKRDTKKKWDYEHDYDWVIGSLGVDHDNQYLYRIPFDKKASYRVLQGFNGGYSHKGLDRYAVDFDMPEGSAVHAAREGIVVDLDARQKGFYPTFPCSKDANYLTILHRDGSTGEYHHLQHNGVLVSIGQHIKRGQFIARSGNTGCSNYPHLHFAVYKAVPGPATQSLKIKFITQKGIVDYPRHGEVHRVSDEDR